MKTSTSAFLWPFKVRITSLAASSGVLGGGFASFQASTNFLNLIQKQYTNLQSLFTVINLITI